MGSLKADIAALTRDRILEVASTSFFKKGFSQTRMEDIALELGVRKPLIYEHFENKLDLLGVVAGQATALAANTATTIVAEAGSASERLARLIETLTLGVVQNRISLGVMFREEKHLLPSIRQRLGKNRQAFNAALRFLLEQGVADGEFSIDDIVVTAEAITGMSTWIFSWYQPEGRVPAHDLSRQMSLMALRLAGAAAPSQNPQVDANQPVRHRNRKSAGVVSRRLREGSREPT